LSSIKYCQLVIVLLITGLVWASGLWIVGVMADDLLPPLPCLVGHIKATMLKWPRNGGGLKSK
jgi:hypothetical protein